MRIIKNFSSGKTLPETALTLGNFDGVHLGHSAIIKALIKSAGEKHLRSALLTFEPHPLVVLKPDIAPFRLTTLEQKIGLVEKLGLDLFFVLKFDKNLASQSADDFVKNIIRDELKAKHLVIGHDFNFGKNREGNADFLRRKAGEYGFTFSQIDSFGGNIPFSSTRAREFLKEGKIKEAEEILGHPFEIRGVVMKGKQHGRDLGFPTANLELGGYLRPKFGVYETLVDLGGGGLHKSIANIGIRPTLGQQPELLEVHIFDFAQDIYGREIKVTFKNFIREEKKFSSMKELKKQITADIEKIKR